MWGLVTDGDNYKRCQSAKEVYRTKQRDRPSVLRSPELGLPLMSCPALGTSRQQFNLPGHCPDETSRGLHVLRTISLDDNGKKKAT